MLKEIRVENWKSYADSTLYIDPLTVLIGTNASGKSNVLDALLFLNRTASGMPINIILQGDHNIPGLRGGLEWACRSGKKAFILEARVSGTDDKTEFVYQIEILTEGAPLIAAESLKRVKYRPKARTISSEIYLFRTDDCPIDAPAITARLYNGKQGSPRPSARQASILSQLHPEAFSQTLRKDIVEGVNSVIKALKGIFILDPIPSHMREYVPLAYELESDAANIAGVIAALPTDKKKQIEKTLTTYIGKLPEKDICRV